MMKDDNEDDLKNKEDLHIGGRHTALDIFRFAVFFSFYFILWLSSTLTSTSTLNLTRVEFCFIFVLPTRPPPTLQPSEQEVKLYYEDFLAFNEHLD